MEPVIPAGPAPVTVATAAVTDVADLADVAARTFPLACPASATEANIAAFIAENLSAARFGEYVSDPRRIVLTARDQTRMLGYAMLIRGVPDDDEVAAAVTARPTVELSKIYVLPDSHGGGVANALMTAALDRAGGLGCRSVWLGVNQNNQRAQRFYGKQGFTVAGTKTFRLGAGIENDYVMVRPLQ